MRIFVVLLFCLIIFKGYMLYHFNSSKEFYIAALNKFLTSEVHSGLRVGDINYKILGWNIGTEFHVKNISLIDSNYSIHHIKTLDIPNVYLKLKLLDILEHKITIKEIAIEQADFNLFELPDGYTNEYLFQSKKNKSESTQKTIKKSKLIASLDIMTINNSKIHILQKKKGKNFDFLINNMSLSPDLISKNMKIVSKLDVVVKQLVFNPSNGSFLTNAHIVSEPMIHFTDTFISCPKSTFNINNIPYNISLIMGLHKLRDTLDIRLTSDEILYKNTISLLSPNLTELLEKFSIIQKISANALISGHLKDATPKIKVHFKLDKHEVHLPFLPFKELSFTGFYINQYNPNKDISDENSAIILQNISGINKYCHLASDSIAITNMLKPFLLGNVNLEGDVKALNDLIPKKEFELHKGTFKIKGLYKNDIEFNLQKLLDIRGTFEFKNVSAWVPSFQYWVQDFNCNVTYSNKQLMSNLLKFNIQSKNDTKHRFSFLSTKSVFDFKEKIKIQTDFKAVSHPEIFHQFTQKYHITPTEGLVKFDGHFNDYIYFDINKIPNINGKLSLENIQVALQNYPIKLLKTNALININRSKANIQHLTTTVVNKNDQREDQSLYFTTQNATAELSASPIVHAHFNIQSKMNPFNGFLKEKSIELKQGTVSIDGDFDGKIEGTYQNLDKIKASILLKDVSIYFGALNLLLEKINSTISLDKWAVNMPHFEANYRMYKIQLALKSKDIIQYWLGLKSTNHTDISFYSKALSINTLEDIKHKIPHSTTPSFANPKSLPKTMMQHLEEYKFLTGSFSFKIDMLNYNKYLLKNVTFELLKKQNEMQLKQCSFNIGEGSGAISGTMKTEKELQHVISNFEFKNISMKYLKNKFPEYLPQNARNLELDGLFHFSSTAQFSITPNDRLAYRTLMAHSNVKINQLSINKYADISPLRPKWVFKKWLQKIEFEPIELHLQTIHDTTYLPKTLIKSNIVDVWLDGNSPFNGAYRLKVKIPYYNFTNFLLNHSKRKDSFQKIKNYIEYKIEKN